MTKLVLDGRVHPWIHKSLTLDRVDDAMLELETGRRFGKIVVEPGLERTAPAGGLR